MKTDLESLHEAYANDATFHVLVDNLVAAIRRMDMTPGEIRAAATYAAYRVETCYPRPVRIPISPEEWTEWSLAKLDHK